MIPLIVSIALACFSFQLVSAQCPKSVRSIDGTCTKWQSVVAGRARSAQFSYFSNLSSASPSGLTLPSARVISNAVHATRFANRPRRSRQRITEFSVFFGQFVDHDIVSTPLQSVQFPISVPRDDPVYASLSFLPFRRSRRARFGRMQRPENEATAALDLSGVYGSNLRRARHLRQFRAGLMRIDTKHDPLGLPPLNLDRLRNSPSRHARNYALCGDHRCNENAGLLSLHTIFLREHNRLAQEVLRVHPNASDEQVYQTARAVNIAQYARIVYREFVPAMIGRALSRSPRYDEDAHPGPSVVFGSAAFRVGHSLVGGKLAYVSRRNGSASLAREVALENAFFQPVPAVASIGISSYLAALPRRAALHFDVFVTSALRNALFRRVRAPSGAREDGRDLAASNIQRGRDHALPSYNAVRALVGRGRAASFAQIAGDIVVRERLAAVYASAEEVEVWTGLLAEGAEGRSALGATASRLWAMEFERMRSADRYYFEPFLGLDESVRRLPAVRELRRVSMRDVLQRNSDLGRGEVRRNLFRM